MFIKFDIYAFETCLYIFFMASRDMFLFINCRICLDEFILLCLCPLVKSLKKMGNFEVSLSKKVCIIMGISHCKSTSLKF